MISELYCVHRVNERYLFPAHVDQQLSAIWTEGHVSGYQDSEAIVIVWEFHWYVS